MHDGGVVPPAPPAPKGPVGGWMDAVPAGEGEWRMAIWILAGLAGLLSGALAWWLSRPGALLRAVDRPGERSLHDRPMPRTGGVGIWLGILPAGASAAGLAVPILRDPYPLAGLALIAAVSLLDDLRGLPPLPRILAHLLAAALLLAGGYGLTDLRWPGGWTLPLGPAEWPVTLLAVVWLSNLYNFMDGMDGFAGGMGLIGFAGLALLGWWGGHPALAGTALLIALANGGFLAFNFPPARIFMGDLGAVPLGFALAFLSLWGIRDGVFPFWAPLLIFSPFVVDATFTLLHRLARGEKVWRAHRSHYYQRLVLLGWGHRRTVLAEYSLMLAAAISVIVVQYSDNPGLAAWMLAGWVAVYLLLALLIERAAPLERR